MAWCFHRYRAAKEKVKHQYDDCYFRCPAAAKEWDEKRRDFCEDCPQRLAKDNFFAEAQANFQERFGEELKRGKFEELLSLVKNVAAFQDDADNIGIGHSHLLSAYLSEKDKHERANRPSV